MMSIEKRKGRPSWGDGRQVWKARQKVASPIGGFKLESASGDWAAWVGFLGSRLLAAFAAGDAAATAAWAIQFEIGMSAWSASGVRP